MLRVVAANILDAEVVNNKGESDVARGMGPEAWGASCGGIAELGEVFLELLVSDEPHLFQAIHAATDFGVDSSIRLGNIVEVVLGDDLVRDDVQWEAHVFVAVHWGANIYK
jgi:hypothetical protein